jgi:sensor domain CHASE-containing protein
MEEMYVHSKNKIHWIGLGFFIIMAMILLFTSCAHTNSGVSKVEKQEAKKSLPRPFYPPCRQ